MGIYLTGAVFILQAVPLLFGGKGSWLTLLLSMLIVGLIAAIVLRNYRLEPITRRSRWAEDSLRRPAINAFKVGVILTATLFILVLLGYPTNDLPEAARVSVASTIALAMGAWATLTTFINFKFVLKVSGSAGGEESPGH
jgi:hypothetical protein